MLPVGLLVAVWLVWNHGANNYYEHIWRPGDLVMWRTNGKLGLLLGEAECFPSIVVVAMLDGIVKQIDEKCLDVISESR